MPSSSKLYFNSKYPTPGTTTSTLELSSSKKDTAVISLLGLHDFLGTANSIVQGQRAWANREAEIFMFVAIVYWLFTFSMSKVSAKMEKAMGVGSDRAPRR